MALIWSKHECRTELGQTANAQEVVFDWTDDGSNLILDQLVAITFIMFNGCWKTNFEHTFVINLNLFP